MAAVITYVCDVSGKSSLDKSDFVEVAVNATACYKSTTSNSGYCNFGPVKINKLVHNDVAQKLGLYAGVKDVPIYPEVTFEGKLKALLDDYVGDIVADHLANPG